MTAVHDAAALLGRILLAYLYIPNGFSKIGGFAGTSGYIASKGLPLPDVGAAIAIAVEVVAGIALLIGWKTRWAALALAVFTLAATFLFHNFWAMPADQQMVQKLMFDKNIAVVGGLLLAYAFGPGRYAVDKS
ncbi:MAG: AraC family transcriptional regulator [Betaproteobacteria bacterium]|nr:MAG: AraC family transcriptional regulator [Betaproteobacteria bacterium]